ncbi:MAG: 2-oxo-4-hydroxy-4-carboxy-5-ureidoimidazoline decarboxylase [Elusimicrobiota bacterium]|nr:MAG: 2-oxo-4-hydroxy-4-carboxy-5-ureidoimidazoline decarboxylase [Elusimicrobiota bacterium]
MTLAELNALTDARAREELLRCCGCERWAADVAAGRPYESKEALLEAADAAWDNADRSELLEAFAHHPRIGGKDALRAKFAATSAWARGEQSGAASADEATLDALAAGNAEYEAKFGHIFIVCATGKSAAQMLDMLKARLPASSEAELRTAAGEQAKITKIRLEKLLS